MMEAQTRSHKNWFITFGDDRVFAVARERLAKQAREFDGRFDVVKVWTPANWGADFERQWGRWVRSHRRGFGYWLWKPWVIKQTLAEMDEGDVLVYLDAGFVINRTPASVKRFDEYVEMVQNDPLGWLSFFIGKGCTVGRWTKRATMNAMNVPKDMYDKWQHKGGIQIIRCSEKTRELADEWWKWSSHANGSLISDAGGKLGLAPGFKDHRHDQAIFSILAHRWNVLSLRDESHFGAKWSERGMDYPFWSKRSRK